ncbi:MAG: hypothetical protein QNJ12_07065 [Ilumatobacter sp.]|uniref:hypothetical protein n=1 Tax=Ilumatobacter sp. TaxID=1967498 RepID=UPI0026080298|nr:hypothetical protein [Ilumatobacter sp.]MDJ0768537.1 hypothetical protein [Ilumatobacter sp.]
MTRRLAFLVVAVLALSACRLDVSVSVEMEPDGTGVVTVVAVADDELLGQVPDLIDDLRLDDAIANGWVVDGPTLVEGGGATITLTHEFRSAVELANVLNSIGPPLEGMEAARTADAEGQVTNAINGDLVLTNGFETFADADLLAAVGGLPFGAEIAASGLTPSQAISFTFRIALPGEIVSSETGTEVDDGVIEWVAPLDGTSVNLRTDTVQRPAGSGNAWASPLATVALVALVVWLVVSAAFIAFVAIARRNKRMRRRRALARLGDR